LPTNDARPICDYEGSDYRTTFWEGQGREYEDAVERALLRRWLPPSGRRLIDIGAGFGRLADLYDGFEQVVLFDYSFSQLAYARQRLGDERFIYVAGDLYRMPLASQTIDCAVMVRVLHHIADVPAALAQVARIVRPNGHYLLEFANKRHLKTLLRHATGRGPDPRDREPYEFADVHFDFHPTWVQERLTEAGFAVKRKRSLSILRLGALKRRVSSQAMAALDRVLQPLTTPLDLGPSVFTQSTSTKTGEPPWVETAALFRCPDCGHEPLKADAQGDLDCSRCGAHWPCRDGVYLFKTP